MRQCSGDERMPKCIYFSALENIEPDNNEQPALEILKILQVLIWVQKMIEKLLEEIPGPIDNNNETDKKKNSKKGKRYKIMKVPRKIFTIKRK